VPSRTLDIIGKADQPHYQESFNSEMSSAPFSGSYNILAVDDSSDNLFLIESILHNEHYNITCVESGEAAIEIVHKSPPDVVLLDVMMPGMDGYEVTRRLRQDPSISYIPILLITAHDQSSLVEGLDAGADDFIHKPVDVNELQARVRSLLRLKRSIDTQYTMIQQRDDFVARLTHDLRTPLVAANRMLKLCNDDSFGNLPDEAKDAIENVIRNNDHLLSMVNTLLEVYRHEAGHKSLTFSRVNLFEIAETVVSELAPIAEEKRIQCQVTVGRGSQTLDKLRFDLEGDYLELRRVITNLVGNALKFTDEGTIMVSLTILDDPPNYVPLANRQADSWLCVTIEDTGLGISEAEQQEIFAWFRQGKHMRSGNGLGLHLSQRIAILHGGGIGVQSQLGQGSRFTLCLPQQNSTRADRD
jgi:two-component system sensor histidine kinase/response regulator